MSLDMQQETHVEAMANNTQDAIFEDNPSTASISSEAWIAPQMTKLVLSPDEERILALYDRLQALRLEIALAKEFFEHKQTIDRRDQDEESTDKAAALKAAQEGLLENRARYVLQKNVVESVMMVAPIVKSVHSGSNTSPIEGDLYPLIEQRDDLSVAVAKKSTELQTTLHKISRVRTETMAVQQRNVELAAELLRLAEEVRQRDEPARQRRITMGEERTEEDELRLAVKRSRQGWKTMKGVASAVVVGSGVDWAADGVLREIVLDEE